MSFLTYIGLGFLGVILFFVGAQILLVARMKGQRGKLAPDLNGKAHRRVKLGKPALFYFYSPSCGACRTMTPEVRKLEKKHQGVFSVDISKDMDIARKFGVMATPTTVIVDKGIIRDILIGPQPQQTLEALVEA